MGWRPGSPPGLPPPWPPVLGIQTCITYGIQSGGNYRIAAVYTAAEVVEAIGEHQAIGRAIQRRDPESAERLILVHVHQALETAVLKL
ncbi:MAG TPA: FCD domain-containing protein [Streptosporangiaceae bacterium]|nr:FCD domain-containing protein [Streptosporangiaceae bacterium]